MKPCNYEAASAKLYPQSWSFITLIFYSFALYYSWDTDKLHMDLILIRGKRPMNHIFLWGNAKKMEKNVCLKEVLHKNVVRIIKDNYICWFWEWNGLLTRVEYHLWKDGILEMKSDQSDLRPQGCGITITGLYHLHRDHQASSARFRGHLRSSMFLYCLGTEGFLHWINNLSDKQTIRR